MEGQDFILVAGVCLLTGFAAGLLVSQLLPKHRKSSEVNDQLNITEKKLQSFRAEVKQSFQHTAELLDDLTRSYREVHNHLAQSAEQLLEDPKENPLEALPEVKPRTEAISKAEVLSPPLDYAPKSSGVLAEDFGIDKVQSAEQITPSADIFIEKTKT